MAAQLVMSRHSESAGGLALSARQTSSDELNPFEIEVISKFDCILAVLRELEGMFSQARQEILRKSSFEGKESGKIFAIKGRVITNRKRYFRSLEGEMQNLDRVFQEQWGKVSRDFTSLKAISGLEEKDGAELTPNKNFIAHTPILNAHPTEPHGPEIVGSSPFVKSVALPSLKRVDAGKKPIAMKLSTPLMRPTMFKASSTTEIEIPKKMDLEHHIIESANIPNPYGAKLPCREQHVEVLQIPEDVEDEDTNKVSKVRLGLLNEIKSTSSGAVQTTTRSVRMIKGHGFKIAQAVSCRDQPFEANDKCTI